MTKLRTKIARIEARNPRNRGLVGLRAKLRRLEEELTSAKSPAMSVSARLGKSIDDPVRLPLGRRLLSALVSKPLNLTRTDDDFYTAIIACRKNLTTCELRYGPMSEWDVSRVTDMSYAFKIGTVNHFQFDQAAFPGHYRTFGYVCLRWDACSRQRRLSQTKFFQARPGEFGAAYKDAPNFSRDLSRWDVSSVTDMGAMFEDFEGDVGDLSQWNTSSVVNMDAMFMQRYNYQIFRYGERYFNDTGEWKASSHFETRFRLDVPRTQVTKSRSR